MDRPLSKLMYDNAMTIKKLSSSSTTNRISTRLHDVPSNCHGSGIEKAGIEELLFSFLFFIFGSPVEDYLASFPLLLSSRSTVT